MTTPSFNPLDPQDGTAHQGWTSLLDALPQGVILVDARGRYLEANPAAARILGLDRETLLSCSLPEPWSNVSAEDGSPLAAEDFPGLVALRGGTPVRRKTLGWGRGDGSTLWLEVSAEPLQGGGALVSFADITEHRVQSRQVERLTELYSALSHVNQAIARSPTREALLDKICEVMVEFGKFAMAWVGWDDPETHEVRVVSQYGDRYGYLDSLRVRSDDTPIGQGGTGTAIREGHTCVVNDFLGSPVTSPWLEAARRSGFAASAAAPIRKDGKACGALMVYASEKNYFGAQEVGLLEEAAGDITFALAAEESLRFSEAKLNLALRSAEMGIWTWDIKENIRHYDELACLLLGIDKDTLVGSKEEFLQVVLPEDHEGIQTALRKTFDENQPYESEFRVRRKDGSLHFICSRGRLVRDEQGQPLQILGINWDITEQKRNLAALLETRQRLQLATTSGSMGVWDWDLVSGSMTWDDRMLELFGATRGEIQGTEQDWKDGLHPEDLDRAIAECTAALRGEAPFDTEFRVRHKDGTILWIKANAVVIRDQHGNAVRMIGLNQDITERRQAEQALLASEEKFSMVYHLSPDAIDLTHLESGVQVEANQSYMRMFGYTREELIGHSTLPGDLGIWVDKEDRERLIAGLKEYGEERGFETLLRRKDGNVFNVQMSSSLLKIAGKLYNLSICHDVSERKKAEEALRESEERFRVAMEATSDGLWDWNVTTGEVFFSPAYARMLGYDSPTFPKQVDSWKEMLFPDDREQVLAEIQECIMGTCQYFQVEHRIRTRDGAVKWVLGRGQAASRDEQGHALRMTGTIVDINERKKAEESLRISEEKFAKIFRLSPDAIDLTRSADGISMDLNHSYTKLLGFTPAEFIGRSTLPGELGIWVNLEDRDRHMSMLKRQGEVLGFEAPLRRKDGSTFIAQISSSGLVIDGEPFNITITRDISERKNAETERMKLQAQLLQSQKMESLGILAGGVAHDINNVLGAILGLATAHIATQPYGSPLHKALDTICKAAERGGKMVKNLLAFSRQTPVEESRLDLNAILRDQARLLERTTLAKVRLRMDLEADLHPILGDASTLTHAFMNLSVNAVDAMPDNGTLTFRTRNVDRDWIEVAVEDTGIGMPREVLEKAMDPFFTTKEVGKGTGIGLSIVHSTVKAHQGRMEIQSEPGQGTCVKLYFPSCEFMAQPSEPAPALQIESSHRNLNVLLVDDDELIQESIGEVLEVLGHGVTTSMSGEEALVKLEAGFKPDVVILDMNMPGLGGSGTLPRLRAQCPTLPVILATGRADQAALNLVKGYPHVTLLSKPFGMRELQQQLEILERM